MPNYWLSTSILSSSLDVHELEAPLEQISRAGGFIATATLKCPWSNREAVIDDLLSNLVPYPRFPSSGAKARQASATFFGGTIADGGLMVPPYARITVAYSQGEDEDESGNIFSETLEPSAEFITVSPLHFRWGSPTGTELEKEEAPGKLIVGLDYVQTRYGLSTLPAAILEPNVVNDANVAASLLGLTFAPETLLYVNSLPSRNITAGGAEKWTMPSRFSFRSHGWNIFWRKETQTWERIYLDTESGGAPYDNFPLTDFSTAGILV